MITFEEVDKAYKEKLVLHKINFTINDGEFVVLIGSSGCGKTTLLKTINKLETVDRGLIKIDNVSIRQQNTLKLRRRIGYVVQDAGLFPHMTIYDNIATVLKINNYDSNNIENRIDELLEMVDLEPDNYKYLYPYQLSGGQYENTSLKEITNAVDYIHFGIVPVLDLKNELVGYLTKSRLLSVLSRQYQDSVRQKDGILA